MLGWSNQKELVGGWVWGFMFILDLGIFKFQNATHNHSANFIKLIKEYQIGRIWDIYEKEGDQEKPKLIPSSCTWNM